MRFYEGCRVLDPHKSFSCIARYVASLFEFSHNTVVFIALEPASIATRVGGVLRRIAIAPGYAILCSSTEYYDTGVVYSLAETVWIESGILLPYLANRPCSGRFGRYGIPLEVDEELGIPYICVGDVGEEQLYKFTSMGGIVELLSSKYHGVGTLKLAPVKDRFFYISKGLGLRSVYSNVRYALAEVNIPPRLEVQSVELLAVDCSPALISIGNSYLVVFESLEPIEEYIYLPLLITVHSLPSSEPKARYYMHRLGSHAS